MEGIRSNVAVTTQQPKKSNKALKHLGNAAVTTAALGATGVGTYKSLKLLGNVANYVDEARYAKTFGVKFFNLMSKIGDKLFPKNGVMHAGLERFAKNPPFFGGPNYNNLLKGSKGVLTLLIGAGGTALAILGTSIYKAGKINGEG